MSKKFCLRRPYEKQHGKRVKICTTELLSDLLITVNGIELEKDSHSDMKNRRIVC